MPIIKPVWTENVSLHGSAPLSFGASATDDIDLDTLGADLVDISFAITFGATPDGDVVVEVLPSTDSGGNDDTVAARSITIEAVAGTTVRRSVLVPARAYIALKVTNDDSIDDVTYEAHYAWRQWSSA